VQHVDRPAQVQPLSEPAGACCICVKAKALGVVAGSEDRDRISGSCRGRRHLGERPTIRALELEGPVGLTRHLIALLVHRAVVPPAEQREVRERRGPALRPVVEMMPLGDANPAAREAAAPISML
jgi:hypothetical protein